MNNRILATLALIFLGLGSISFFQLRDLEQTRLIFCDVGQGDGILITSGTKQVVVDGGPGNKMVDCLGAKMPFWDRQIEMVVLTHPQRDHMEGLIGVLERYDVGTVVSTGVPNDTEVFRAWERAVEAERARVYLPHIGDRFVVNPRRGTTLSVLWPDRDQAARWQQDPPTDLNETSIVMRLEWDNPSTRSARSGQLCAYLTGDIPKEILVDLIDRGCQILKVSHHGSKTGTSKEVLDKAKPKVAVIQVGKNSFGHPHKEVLDLLYQRNVKVLRSDTDGKVEITADGKQLIIDKSASRRNN